MALPNRDTRGAGKSLHARWNKRSSTSGCGRTLQMMAGAILLIVVLRLMTAGDDGAISQQQIQQQQQQQPSSEQRMDSGPMRELEKEPAFLKTLKSCLPQTNKHCKIYIPPHTTTERIALVTPPGHIGERLHELLQSIVATTDDAKFDLIHTTSIPPYGYGKTHGWTRIIRFVPTPMLMGVMDTMQWYSETGGVEIASDADALLRQYVRYHCRLSHIAAHTSLWTIRTSDVLDGTAEDFVAQAKSFLGISTDTISLETSNAGAAFASLRLVLRGLQSADSESSSRLVSVQANGFDAVLDRELKISKDLSNWPCESFWTVGDDHGPASSTLELSPFIQSIATAMSPNCTAPLTKCFVKRDKCEAAGDGPCH